LNQDFTTKLTQWLVFNHYIEFQCKIPDEYFQILKLYQAASKNVRGGNDFYIIQTESIIL